MNSDDKKQTPVFMLNNVNGSFALSFNEQFREYLVGATKAYLALEGHPVVSAFGEAMKSLQDCTTGIDSVKYAETVTEERQWQESLFVLSVVNGSFFLSCNGSFGRLLMDIVDASGDEETHTLPKPMYALAVQLEKQIHYKKRA